MHIPDLIKLLPETISDNDLYLLTRKFWLNELLFSRRCEFLDWAYALCSRRNIKIFDDAMKDSYILYLSIVDGNSCMKVTDIKRIDYLDSYELQMLLHNLGAATNYPSPESVEQTATNLFVELGVPKDSLLLCKVSGESMTDARIYDGDTLVVDTSAQPNDGNIVVVSVNNQYLVKRLRVSNNTTKLISEHPDYPDILIDSDTPIKFFGVVRRVLLNV